jgi:subtilase family serine protease
MRIHIARRAARAYPAALFISQQSSEVQLRRLVSVLGVVSILLGATAPAVAGVTVGASGLTRSVVDVCGPAMPGEARCHAKLVVYGNGLQSGLQPFASSPSGFNPSDLWSAYQLSSSSTTLPIGGAAMTVAIVDAYDDPKAESDLAVYRSKFSLPPCTTKTGCFQKVNQSRIAGNYPKGNRGWAEEISLDLDMVSAICPNCKILLVEATSATFANLGAAEYTAAVTLGANAISNSYGGSEFNGETSYDSYYNHPGVAITVSSGDSGYGVQYPAASQYVTAVGGTSLYRTSSTNRPGGWSETAWSGAGSGCSAYEPKPSWQTDSGCLKNRTVADVSAVADPNTGVSVYDTYGVSGWLVFGGTSVASPIIASVYALAGNARSIDGSFVYTNASKLKVYDGTPNLNDITSGSNGSCGGSYLCTAGTGYDGPTGLGTPNGTGGF